MYIKVLNQLQRNYSEFILDFYEFTIIDFYRIKQYEAVAWNKAANYPYQEDEAEPGGGGGGPGAGDLAPLALLGRGARGNVLRQAGVLNVQVRSLAQNLIQ